MVETTVIPPNHVVRFNGVDKPARQMFSRAPEQVKRAEARLNAANGDESWGLTRRAVRVWALTVGPGRWYSTTARNRNRVDRKNLEICLSSSQKNRNSLAWVLPTLSVCLTSILTHIESRPNLELASGNCKS